jgi:hypothetical protein
MSLSATDSDGLANPNDTPPSLLLLVPNPPECSLYGDPIAGLGGDTDTGSGDGPTVELLSMLSWLLNVGFQDEPNACFGDDPQAKLLLILSLLLEEAVNSFDGELEVDLLLLFS